MIAAVVGLECGGMWFVGALLSDLLLVLLDGVISVCLTDVLPFVSCLFDCWFVAWCCLRLRLVLIRLIAFWLLLVVCVVCVCLLVLFVAYSWFGCWLLGCW